MDGPAIAGDQRFQESKNGLGILWWALIVVNFT